MIENFVGEEDSNDKEETGSPMWRFLKEEYDYKRPQRGDIRYAEVVRVDDDEIIVDIGGKTEGVVPSYDLQKMGEEARDEIEVGDKVPVYVLRPESAEGNVIVSLNMARTVEDWRKAEKLYEEGDIFEGTVSGHNKGGLLVYFGRIRGFVPSSQLATFSRQSRGERRMEMLSGMEGRRLMLKAIEVDRERRRLIFSERAATREWREKQKEMLLNDLQEGDIRVGTVRNLCDFGAFVDLGGADGLIHISELSWRRVKHPREVLGVGDEVEVYVLRVDRRRKRIGLSLKRLKPDPWQLAEESYHVGEIVKGVITNVVSFGAFARIDDGIEGLIHISQLADGDFSPRDLVKEGEEVYLKILGIDASRKRMSLSLKQAPTRAEMEGEEALAEMRAEAAVELEEEAPIAVEAVTEIEEREVAVEPEEKLEVVVELEEEAPIAFEAVIEIEEELEEAVQPEEELEAAVELEEEAPVAVEAVAEIEEEREVAVEPEEELEAAAELEEEAPVAFEAVIEIEEELEVAVQPEEELEAAVELEEEAPVAVEAVAEIEEEREVAVEPEGELEAAAEIEEEAPIAVEAVIEIEEELEVAVQPEEELEAAVELEEEAPVAVEATAEIEEEPEAEVEPEEELEAAAELEEEAPVMVEAVAEIEEEPEAAVEPEEELEAATELEEEAPIAVEAVAEIEEEPEAAVEPEEELEAVAELEEEAPIAVEAAPDIEEELEVAFEPEEELEAVSETEEEESLKVGAAAEKEDELEAAAEPKVETEESEAEEGADQEEVEALDLIEET